MKNHSDLWTLGDVGTELFQNVGNLLPTVIASHARRTGSLITSLW